MLNAVCMIVWIECLVSVKKPSFDSCIVLIGEHKTFALKSIDCQVTPPKVVLRPVGNAAKLLNCTWCRH